MYVRLEIRSPHNTVHVRTERKNIIDEKFSNIKDFSSTITSIIVQNEK